MKRVENHSITRVTTYDRTNGVLVASIMLFGFLVTVLFVVWCSHRFEVGRSQPPVDPTWHPVPTTPVSDVELLDLRDLPFAAAPAVSEDLQFVTEVVSKISAAEFRVSDTTSPLDSDGERAIGPDGDKDGDLGTGRKTHGPKSAGKRWSVVYKDLNFDQYKSMLGQLKIELGVVFLSQSRIVRVKPTTDGWKTAESNRELESKSFYFQNQKSIVRRWDRKITSEFGLTSKDTITVHFYPTKLLQEFNRLEQAQLQSDGKTLNDIETVSFVVNSLETGFKLKIDRINYRQGD